MQPDFASEGASQFTLSYSMLQGTVEQETWLFHGIQINSNSHYSVENRSLVVLRPTRTDTGPYALLLTNPFNNVTVNRNVTVLCKLQLLEINSSLSPLKLSHISLPPCLRWTRWAHPRGPSSSAFLHFRRLSESLLPSSRIPAANCGVVLWWADPPWVPQQRTQSNSRADQSRGWIHVHAPQREDNETADKEHSFKCLWYECVLFQKICICNDTNWHWTYKAFF